MASERRLSSGRGVLIIQLGTPDAPTPEALRPYLKQFLGDPRVIEGPGQMIDAKFSALPFLVPQVDADGNERAGIRVPEQLVPLATTTGWNFRAERIGNRLVAGMISAALISGIGGIVTSERRFRKWEDTLLGTGIGVIGALGGYLAYTAARRRRRPR